MNIFPENKTQIIYNNQLEKLKSLYKEYNIYCHHLKNELDTLITLIIYSDITFNLYYKNKIINYQTINNVSLNLKFLQKDIDLLESIFNKNKYTYFLSTILNKQGSKISQNNIKIPSISEEIKIIPLINNNINGYNKNIENNKYFAIYYSIKEVLYIYNINGNLINRINLNEILEIETNYKEYNKSNKFEMIQYESNILLIVYNTKFIFILFSDDFKNNEIATYNYKTNNKRDYQIKSKMKLNKMNSKDVLLLLNYNLYFINFNKSNNSEKMSLNNTLNKEKEYIFDILPINYKINNNIIKEMICLTQKKYNLYYDDDDCCYDDDLLQENKIDRYKIIIIIYSNDLNEKDSFTINCKVNLFDVDFLELNYNYLNNMLLIFLNDNILQINLKTKQITTNYIIESLYFLKTKKNNKKNKFGLFNYLNIGEDNKEEEDLEQKKPFKIFSFHNYNEETK